MRALILAVVVALVAMPAGAVEVTTGNNVIVSRGSTTSGPRILGEPAFAFELDALTQDEVSRPGWPVTTTRASTRMCFTGTAWQTVPANTPCIGRYGLASFGAGTNYIANSTAPVLTLSGGATVATVTEGGVTFQRITMPAGSKAEITPAAGPVSGDAVVATVEVKGSGGFLLSPETSTTGARAVTLGAAWARESFGRTSTTAPRVVMHATSASVVDLAQAQLERGTTTPGPRHDCGEAPCSWSADRHRFDASGWGASACEVRLRYSALNPTATGTIKTFFDTRTTVSSPGCSGIRGASNTLGMSCANGSTSDSLISSVQTFGSDDELVFRWCGGQYEIRKNGVQVASKSSEVTPPGHSNNAALGMDRNGDLPADGFIRLLRVSQ